VGLDLGAGVSWTATSAVRVHGQLSLATSVGIGRGPHQARAGLAPTVGVELVPSQHFAFVFDVVSSLGYQGGLDWVAPAVSIRTAIGPRVGVELNALLPLVGPTPRALARAGLRVTVRL